MDLSVNLYESLSVSVGLHEYRRVSLCVTESVSLSIHSAEPRPLYLRTSIELFSVQGLENVDSESEFQTAALHLCGSN